MKRNEVSISIKVTNRLSARQSLVVEPWLTEYDLPPGKTLTVIMTGDPAYPLEIETAPKQVTIHAFDSAGANYTVLDGGNKASHIARQG